MIYNPSSPSPFHLYIAVYISTTRIDRAAALSFYPHHHQRVNLLSNSRGSKLSPSAECHATTASSGHSCHISYAHSAIREYSVSTGSVPSSTPSTLLSPVPATTSDGCTSHVAHTTTSDYPTLSKSFSIASVDIGVWGGSTENGVSWRSILDRCGPGATWSTFPRAFPSFYSAAASGRKRVEQTRGE